MHILIKLRVKYELSDRLTKTRTDVAKSSTISDKQRRRGKLIPCYIQVEQTDRNHGRGKFLKGWKEWNTEMNNTPCNLLKGLKNDENLRFNKVEWHLGQDESHKVFGELLNIQTHALPKSAQWRQQSFQRQMRSSDLVLRWISTCRSINNLPAKFSLEFCLYIRIISSTWLLAFQNKTCNWNISQANFLQQRKNPAIMICFKVFDPIDNLFTKGTVFTVKYQTEMV